MLHFGRFILYKKHANLFKHKVWPLMLAEIYLQFNRNIHLPKLSEIMFLAITIDSMMKFN